MALFDNMLKGDESLFINEEILDFNYLPKFMKYREEQQRYMADCIKPLFYDKNGRNLLITGKPGIGKTAATRFVLSELEEKNDDIFCIYVNCWKENTGFKVISNICEQVGYKWTQNRKINELLKECSNIINKKKAVIVLDEIDKLTEQDILYSLLEVINKKCIFLITNDVNFLAFLDNRVRSRLIAEVINFKEYNLNETEGILKQRIDLAFVKNIWEKNAFNIIVKKCYSLKDIRSGLFLIKEAGNIAENEGSKKILLEHAKRSTELLNKYKLRDSQDFYEENKDILNVIKEHPGRSCSELFRIYIKNNKEISYKTFRRKIDKLKEDGIINLKNSDSKGIIVSYGSLKKA